MVSNLLTGSVDMKYQLCFIIAQLAVSAKATSSSQQEVASDPLSETLDIPTTATSETGYVGAVTSVVHTTETPLSYITPTTVYAFSDEGGAASDVLQLPTGSPELLSSSNSDSIDASSALSQFLNGGGATTSRSGLTASGTHGTGRSESASSRVTTRLAANSSITMTTDHGSSSSTNSISVSGGANKVRLPVIAGGLMAGLVAFL